MISSYFQSISQNHWNNKDLCRRQKRNTFELEQEKLEKIQLSMTSGNSLYIERH